jgi:hypothetical protein
LISAVAANLLNEGKWDGPALLLAPAQSRVQRYSNYPRSFNLDSFDIRIIHAIDDTTVKIEDSRRLFVGKRHRLTEIEADNHRLDKWSNKNLVREVEAVLRDFKK